MTSTKRWRIETQVEGIILPLLFIVLAYGAWYGSQWLEGYEIIVAYFICIFLACNAIVMFKLLFIDRVRILREREAIERKWS